MTRENPYAWQEWMKARLLFLLVLLVLAVSVVFAMAVAEMSIATNGIAVATITVALLTIFYAVFCMFSCFFPYLELRHTFLSVTIKIQIVTWLSVVGLGFSEVNAIQNKENSYNSSYWGEGSGLSHGCSWADSGRYPDKGSYNKTCSLVKARFSISWVPFILLYIIFNNFLFGPKKILDRENEERRRQAWRDEERGVESRAAEQEGEATEQAI